MRVGGGVEETLVGSGFGFVTRGLASAGLLGLGIGDGHAARGAAATAGLAVLVVIPVSRLARLWGRSGHLGAKASDDVGAAALVGVDLEQAFLLGVFEQLAEG